MTETGAGQIGVAKVRPYKQKWIFSIAQIEAREGRVRQIHIREYPLAYLALYAKFLRPILCFFIVKTAFEERKTERDNGSNYGPLFDSAPICNQFDSRRVFSVNQDRHPISLGTLSPQYITQVIRLRLHPRTAPLALPLYPQQWRLKGHLGVFP